jgi:AcrR family transcriptional regulator
MARPRTASDEDILRAAFTAITRLGPARLTLAEVAREAGLTPAALVVRFGSKRALLLAAAADAAGGDAYIFPGLRARHASPLAALYGLADCLAELYGGAPESVAHNLAFAQSELSDPEFHQHALKGSQGMRAGIRALVRDAIAKGELIRCDASRLASAVQATITGSMIGWATHRKGGLAAWLRRDLGAVLDPYRAPARRRTGARRTAPSRAATG